MKYHMWNWLVNIIKRIKNIISNCSLPLNPSFKQRNYFFPLVSNLFSALRIAVTGHPVVTPYTKYFTFSYLFWHSHPLTFSICHASIFFLSWIFFLSFIFVQFLFLFNWSLCRHWRLKVHLFFVICSKLLAVLRPCLHLGYFTWFCLITTTAQGLFFCVSLLSLAPCWRFKIVGSLTPDNLKSWSRRR